MSTCDICGDGTSWDEGTCYSADEFRRLVRMGFSPVERMEGQLAMVRALTGQTTEEFLSQWKQGLVTECTTDWLLCPGCAPLAGRYLPKAAGGGRSGAPLWEPLTASMLGAGKGPGTSDLAASLAALLPLPGSGTSQRQRGTQRWAGFARHDVIRTVVFLAVLLGLFGLSVRLRAGVPQPHPVNAATGVQAAPAASPVVLTPGHPVLREGETLIFPPGTRLVDTTAGRIAYSDSVRIQPGGKSDWEYEVRPTGGSPLKIKVNPGGLEGVIGLQTDDGAFHLGADQKTTDRRLLWIRQPAEVLDRAGTQTRIE